MEAKHPDAGPLTKALFAFVLLMPGGFVAAPVLWFARKHLARRADVPGPAAA